MILGVCHRQKKEPKTPKEDQVVHKPSGSVEEEIQT